MTVLLLAGCSLLGITPPSPTIPVEQPPVSTTDEPSENLPDPTPTESTPNPLPTEVHSVSDLHDLVVAAGYSCPNWTQTNDIAGQCNSYDGIYYYQSQSKMSDVLVSFKIMVNDGMRSAMLVGSNWIIMGIPEELAALQKSIGGELFVDPNYQSPDSMEFGKQCRPTKAQTSESGLTLIS
ncbi:MAG: hypothetical protein FWD55_07535, partial [Propionibacteriaceae bacterium]|nr:hypothetical protein [Propionibacteriaceae bacterium]